MADAEQLSEHIGSESKPVTVGTLADQVSRFVNQHNDQFPEYVVGEVSDVSEYDFGTFFDLTDPDGDATITCIAWSHAVKEFDESLESGTTGVFRASLDFYADSGNLQLNVSNFWARGKSERTEEWAQLEASLKSEGLIGPDATRPLPSYPTCVGVVTARESSAAEDICEAIHRQDPRSTIKIHDATVQGEEAVQSIVTAVTALDRDPEVDVIVVTRGGGADATLWSFNEEPLVRCVAERETPTVAAIGHEDDVTLVERVADQRCMTPSDAGLTVATDLDQMEETVQRLQERIEPGFADLVTDRLESVNRRIDTAVNSVIQRVQSETRQQLQRARGLEDRICQSYRSLVDRELSDYENTIDAEYAAVEHRVAREQQNRRQQIQRAAELEGRIRRAYASHVETRLDTLSSRIESGFVQTKHRTETQSLTQVAAVSRAEDVEARIDTAYQSAVDKRISNLEWRIAEAQTQIESESKIESKKTEIRYLRFGLAILLLVVLGLVLYIVV